MNRTFEYNWGELKILIFALPLTVALILFNKGYVEAKGIAVLAAIFGFGAIGRSMPLRRVIVTSSDITIRSLLPFGPGGCFTHNQIQGYAELAGKDMGNLQPKGMRMISLSASGVKDFAELNKLFLETYPTLEGEAEQENAG